MRLNSTNSREDGGGGNDPKKRQDSSPSSSSSCHSSATAGRTKSTRKSRKAWRSKSSKSSKSTKSRGKGVTTTNGVKSDSDSRKNGIISSKKISRKLSRGKVFPKSPPPPLTQVTPTTTTYNRQRVSEGLVDYDDFATSSTSTSTSRSISSCSSENEKVFQSHRNLKLDLDLDPVDLDPHPSSKDLRGTLYLYDDMDNVPCSSSSLRDKLSQTYTSTPSTSKVASKTSVVPAQVEETAQNDEHKVDDDKVDDDKFDHDINQEMNFGVNFDPEVPLDKYMYSGMGRHYGKRRTLSSGNLTDGESASGFSGGGFASVGGGSTGNLQWFGCFMRLKAVTLVFFGTLLILSLASLLFIFPIIVDPILLGMEAEFSPASVTCRTTKIRNGTGPLECTLPSCREGCTADIFQCIFIQVDYTLEPNSSKSESDFSESANNLPDNSSFLPGNFTSVTKNATLFININGCGYPPGVNCTEFLHIYGKIGTLFECFYSAKNYSFVVPYYNVDEEKGHLYFAILLPISLSLFSLIVLILVLKCCNCSKSGVSQILSKSVSQVKLLDNESVGGSKKGSKKWKKRKQPSMNGSVGGKLKKQKAIHAEEDAVGPYMNGSIPKANGHAAALQDTIAGLMGMKSSTELHQNIQKLPHQHDSFEKSFPYLNGSPIQQQQRKPRYAKKNEVKGPPPPHPPPPVHTPPTSLFSKSTKTNNKEEGVVVAEVEDTF